LAIILSVAFVVSYLARALKQPVVIGYIIAGMIISPFIIQYGASKEIIGIFSKFGIAFLLFIVGLHMNPKVINEIGVSSLLIGLAQVILTFGAGFLISFKVLGYDSITSAYVGIALAFSSTIIVMKLLSDRGQLDSLFGKISIGILIIQDLVAVSVLMFISSTLDKTTFGSFSVGNLFFGAGLIAFLFLLGFFVLPRITKNIAKSNELLFLFSITCCFLIAALFNYLGFSIEIGALVAGIVLSISPYSIEMSSKIRSLRDFFLIIFFIILGLNIKIGSIWPIITDAVLLSLAVLVLKSVILMGLMAMFGYTKRTNFLVGVTLAQISEFSLIILALGVSMGHISSEILSTLTLTGIITIAFSTYLIIYSNAIYQKISGVLSVFEKKGIKRENKIKKKYDAVLFGYNRIGFSILNSLQRMKKSYLIVDFNPDVISDLSKLRIPCVYGDVFDTDFLNELPLEELHLAVSTVPDFETNFLLIESIKEVNPDAIVIARAHTINDALELYKKGADYVLTPHFLGGDYVANMIDSLKTNQNGYKEEKAKHIKMLTERMKHGQEHPEVERD